MADYNLSIAELALGYFDGTTIKPDGSIIAGYSNSMGDLLHEWTLNYLDSEAEEDRIGSLTLTRNGGVSKTPDGQTGWAATLDTGTLSASYILPQEASVLVVFKRSTTGTMGLVHVTDQLRVWIDASAVLNIWFKDNSGAEHSYTGTTTITNDVWHQITVGVGSGKFRVTLDRNLEIDQIKQSWTGFYQPSSGTFTIGSDGTNYFTGQIDRIKIYNRVLGQQDATDEFNWNCLLGDFPATAYYRTPWLKLDTSINEVLAGYSWTSTVPTGTTIDENNASYGSGNVIVLPDSTPTGTVYGNVVRALTTDSIKYRGLLASSGYAIGTEYVALEFVLTQA